MRSSSAIFVAVTPRRARKAIPDWDAFEHQFRSEVFAKAMRTHAGCCPNGLVRILETSEPKLTGADMVARMVRRRHAGQARYTTFCA
jgi:5,10-methylene-tetrahydrofolate dehydrogenase/methenyl tetrahydrofolate cyclohydrolase